MKNLIFLALLFVATIVTAETVAAPKSKDNKSNQGAQISFSQTEVDFGEISSSGGLAYREVVVTNTGKSPLIILSISTTCSCTKTEYTKTPIKPGEKGTIKISYDPARQRGVFVKTLAVSTNAASSPTALIVVKGSVVNK